MKAILILALLIFSSLTLLADCNTSIASEKKHRDQELFLIGANCLANKRFDEGRIILNTLIYTYPESPLKDQARVLLFYSYASEGGAKNEKAASLLKEIDEQVRMRERMLPPQ